MDSKTEIFIAKALKVHGNRYDYSCAIYENAKNYVDIKCPIHGVFKQSPNSHLNGSGCVFCGRIRTNKSKVLSAESFFIEAKRKHGDRYDYSKVIYKGRLPKIDIVCREHGSFLQSPEKHLSGQGCPKCARELKNYNQMTTAEFIEKAEKVHGDKYDYSETVYKKSCIKVRIKCQKHGIFEQIPNNHLRGNGCLKCGNEKNGLNRRLSTEEFIEKARKIHGNKYDYSEVIYVDTETKVKIICPLHGKFLQKAAVHLANKGCPMCRESVGERKITLFLENQKMYYQRQKKFKACKYKKLLAFDFYIPSLNTCIEYDGKQHFIPVDYFGGLREFQRTQKVDEIKRVFCQNHKINLLRISYKDKYRISSILASNLIPSNCL